MSGLAGRLVLRAWTNVVLVEQLVAGTRADQVNLRAKKSERGEGQTATDFSKAVQCAKCGSCANISSYIAIYHAFTKLS